MIVHLDVANEQEFCAVEASITVKIKGVTKSQLQDRAKRDEGNFILTGH